MYTKLFCLERRYILRLRSHGPENVLKFVRVQLFTRNRTNYRPKSVHTEADEFVPVRPGRINITLRGLSRFFLVCMSHFWTTDVAE